MEALKDMAMNKFKKISIFQGGKVCHKPPGLLIVNAEKQSAKLEKWGPCQVGMT